MKTYSYKCPSCGVQFGVHEIENNATIYCPLCGEEVNRDYKREANPIHYHGSGFFKTDNKENKKNG